MKKFFLALSLLSLLTLGACAGQGTQTLSYHQWVPTGEQMQTLSQVPPPEKSSAPAVKSK